LIFALSPFTLFNSMNSVSASFPCASSASSFAGTDHGAASLMMMMGGSVRGNIYGTAPVLNPVSGNPTLENNGGDVTWETDFRPVYAGILDNWIGVNSMQILNGDYRKPSLNFI
jgi:uncharacterized protein (DUF1501 family)